MFGFRKQHTIVSYVPSKNKAVLMSSTMYKPDIILHYNKTKGAVDTTDKMVKDNSARRISNRWQMAIFGQLLDVAALNAFISLSAKFPDEKSKSKNSRSKFLLDLGESLIRENVIRRFKTEPRIPNSVQSYVLEMFPELEKQHEIHYEEPERPVSGRCYLCNRKNDR
ncbi:uncharacterized protein LOC132708207 [Cylas formicarius]|uniref:uncharacterized protein LOC132708207 n=1 Tax=Cylas formicarius TaxID=197179 RepID=UPI002958DA8C|nr:uncharacterized protein LOC132708207 [Cylas formicarius]